MAIWLRRFWDWFSPRVCGACDGGSGTTRDRMTGNIRVCEVCGGTGRERRESNASK